MLGGGVGIGGGGVGGYSQQRITAVSGALYSVENNGISAAWTATLFLF